MYTRANRATRVMNGKSSNTTYTTTHHKKKSNSSTLHNIKISLKLSERNSNNRQKKIYAHMRYDYDDEQPVNV